MNKYNPGEIEKKWQEYWATNNVFAASDDSTKPKKYVLMEFPFPSGDGLHMGHVRGYTAGDVVSRYYRMNGFEVMYPIGWDAFGLPAENYAIKHGKQPAETTAQNIANIKKQFQSIGYSFDWNREVNTTDPEYYKWTQWLFLKFYEAGLAYESTGLINWCPKDKTGLANEEVVGGVCERCGTKVEKKELRQWYLKITEYAEKLLEGLKNLPEWPEAVKLQQENWIGKSEGAEIEFYLDFKKDPSANDNRGPNDEKANIKVFTTRPDTIFGATFLVLAPEHLWVQLATDESHDVLENKDEVLAYIESVKDKDDIERMAEGKEKTGVELKGVKAINPATNEEIPMFVADYVLNNYGTGAIMAVPAHDERDFEFAKKYQVPIHQVVMPPQLMTDETIPPQFTPGMVGKPDNTVNHIPWMGPGKLINSGEYDGKDSESSTAEMAAKFGIPKTTYRLRDWVFSRQRYWGEPIPLVHCEKDGVVPVPVDQLPVVLPEVKDYEPTGTGESPLAAIDEWVNTICPKCGGAAKRETNTMPQWAGSSWYYMRYADPKNDQAFANQDKLKHWLPVDLYFGGMEHTTLHLLYSRFWNIFLYDQGLVPVSEPYTKRIPHGIILAEDGSKMSKSKGNVVNPDKIVREYGADVLRMYELFLGPHEASVSWSDKGIIGVARFLDRVWFWINETKPADTDHDEVERAMHGAIKKITEDLENHGFNTMVSALMELHNIIKDKAVSKDSMINFVKLMHPSVPHIAEELYEILGGEGSLQTQSWPKFDETKLVANFMRIAVQVNGKVRDTIKLDINSTEEVVKQTAMKSEKIIAALDGKEPQRIIYVPGRLLNLVL
jgi:leucyl-tRNA synthetase